MQLEPSFGFLNLDHAQRRRLRRVLEFVWDLVFGAWNFHDFFRQAIFARLLI
jgi:hypothetical protein